MMYDSAPIHKRMNLVKTYKKNVLPQKWIVVAEVSSETYSKNDKKKKVESEKQPQT